MKKEITKTQSILTSTTTIINLIFVVVGILCYVRPVFSMEVINEQVDYGEKARKRNYPGGHDEENIKVNDTLTSPVITIYRSTVDKQVLEELENEKEETNDPKNPTKKE